MVVILPERKTVDGSRDVTLDWIRGLVILLIVYNHLLAAYGAVPVPGFRILALIFIVPLFFVISGQLFHFEKWHGRFRAFAWRRFERLMLPYFFVNLCFLLPLYALVGRDFPSPFGSDLPLGRELIGIFYGSLIDGWMNNLNGQLWFLPSLFVGELMFYVVLSLTSSPCIRWGSVLLLGWFGYCLKDIIMLPWSANAALTAQMFLMAGYTMQQYRWQPGWKSTVLAMLLVILLGHGREADLSAENLGSSVMVYYLIALAGSMICISLGRAAVRLPYRFQLLLAACGRHSLGVLFWHMMGFVIAGRLAACLFSRPLITYPFWWFYALAVALLFTFFVIVLGNIVSRRLLDAGYSGLARLFSW